MKVQECPVKRNVLVWVDKAVIHWHREGSDFFQCGDCGPDILYTYEMKHVTCAGCKRSMYRTKEWRWSKKPAAEKGE